MMDESNDPMPRLQHSGLTSGNGSGSRPDLSITLSRPGPRARRTSKMTARTPRSRCDSNAASRSSVGSTSCKAVTGLESVTAVPTPHPVPCARREILYNCSLDEAWCGYVMSRGPGATCRP